MFGERPYEKAPPDNIHLFVMFYVLHTWPFEEDYFDGWGCMEHGEWQYYNIIIETSKRPTAYRESSIFASQHALCFNDPFQSPCNPWVDMKIISS